VNDEQSRIVDDLAGLLAGELRCDPLTVSMYASDASLYQIKPIGVVFPRHRDDVETVVKYCAEMHVPIVARGAGSGVSGESLGAGLIMDFTRFMRRTLDVGDETVRVQPGMVLQKLNAVLRPYGRYFPPDPSRYDVTTVGSMVAVDGAGSHSIRVGSTRDHVQSLEMILANGKSLELGVEPLLQIQEPVASRSGEGVAFGEKTLLTTFKRQLVGKVAKLLRDNAGLIKQFQPPLIRNRCGYYLRNLLTETSVNFPRMLVGSEGTLGLFTAATLHTSVLPPHRALVLLLFGQMETATQAVREIIYTEPTACDLLDRRLLSLGRESDPRFAHIISPSAEAALMVEHTGTTREQCQDRIKQVLAAVKGLSPAPYVAHIAYTYEEVEFLWSLPHRVVPLLSRLQGSTRPLPFVEDIAVPPEALHEFLVAAQNVFKAHQVTASLYSHAAAGQIHLRPFLPPPTQADAGRIEEIACDLYEAVFAVGGTISGEHAAGLSRTAFIPDQYGPLYDVFRELKNIFDPHNLMNPGKIINDDPHLTVRNLRPENITIPNTVELHLKWQPEELAHAAARCNGCGSCRTQDPDLRMCPVFRLDPVEEASPRSKANLMRSYLLGSIRYDDLSSPAMKRISNLCFNCKQCEIECPSSVNIPQMMTEGKAAYVAAHGLSRADWVLSRIHSFGNLLAMSPRLINWMLSNPTARWAMEKLCGIARQRKLPKVSQTTFLKHARRQLLTRPVRWNEQQAVVYFVDHYANWHDPQLGRALVAVLRHHGISVYVPPSQVPSGMAMISAGDLDSARKLATKNIKVLAEFAREGIPILCTEPTAALCLKQEYPALLDHPDVDVIAENTIEAGAYLSKLHQAGKLRTDFRPLDLDVIYHTPCHLKALEEGTPLLDLLHLIPQLRIHTIEKGCSGMAGTYGLSRENFRNSLKIGWGLISSMRDGKTQAGVTECSGCKLQMEQGTTTPTVHPLLLLALAYGLMPELNLRLRPNKKPLTVS
jgi:FAD/FMN-containing dehydrogenase/Fe-S oxidoreductase